jgi:hypothetical protein
LSKYLHIPSGLDLASLPPDRPSLPSLLLLLSKLRGIYKKEPCAVKLIFTTDLTEEVISRITAEATLLSAVHVPPLLSALPFLTPISPESQRCEDHWHLCSPSKCVHGAGVVCLWFPVRYPQRQREWQDSLPSLRERPDLLGSGLCQVSGCVCVGSVFRRFPL